MRRSLRSWLWRVPLDQEVDEELAFHLEMRTRELMERGLSPVQAREEALRRLGDLKHLRRTCVDIGRRRDREMRLTQWIEEFRDDVKFAARQLGGAPAFTLVAILTLALGIGATSSIFSVLHAVVLKPFPFPEPERVMSLGERWEQGLSSVSAGNFHDWSTHARTYTAMAAMRFTSFTLSDGETPERVIGGRVTYRWFDVFGMHPQLGRTFTAEEDAPGRERVVVLSHRLWTRRFAADPAIVSRDIRVNSLPHMVLGVMPAAFDFTSDSEELWTPVAFTAEQLAYHDDHDLTVVARLAPGVSREQAQAEAEALGRQMQAKYPGDQQVHGASLDPFTEQVVGDYRQRLLVLLGAVMLVLLIACGNVANLLLARGGIRAREIALRAAIGAGRGRIVRQLLTEALVLAVAGGGIGVAAAYFAVPLLVASSPEGVPRLEQAQIDGIVIAFAFAAAVFSAVGAGLAPAVRAARSDLRATLNEGGRGGSSGRDLARLLLVAGEVSLAVVLLVGAGLLVRSALYLQRVEPGFEPRGVLTARLTLPSEEYRDPLRVVRTYEDLAASLSASPLVEGAAVSSLAPLTPGGNSNGLVPRGKAFDPRTVVQGMLHIITPDYFRTLRVPLKRGRLLTADDRRGAPRVMIVNETTARRLFPGEDPIGKQVGCCEGAPDRPVYKTIVGIVGDIRSRGSAQDPQPEFFLPIGQAPDVAWDWIQRSMSVVIRSRTGDAAAMTPILRDAVRRMDPTVPVFQMRTMEQRMQASLAQARFNTILMLLLGGIGLVLAAIGVYGVIAYFVAQRQREIGIRMALGAGGAEVVRLVVRQGMQPVVLGVVVGIVGAVAASRVLTSYVYGVTTTDPLTFACVVGVLLAVAFGATVIPARRAVRVDPTRVLNSA